MITTVFSVIMTLPSKGGRLVEDHGSNIWFHILEFHGAVEETAEFWGVFLIYSLIAYGACTLIGYYLRFLGVFYGPLAFYIALTRGKSF